MAEYSSAQRYSVSKPVPISSSPPYGAPYPPPNGPVIPPGMGSPGMAPPGMVPPPMGPPMVVTQPAAAIVVNQVVPNYSVVAHTSSPFATQCPYCKSAITTTAVQTFNCATCMLCCWTGLVLFICIQLCRGKDICCYDAVHRCPSCGQTVAVYNSC